MSQRESRQTSAAAEVVDDGPMPLRLAVLVLWVEAGILALLSLVAAVWLLRIGWDAVSLDLVIVALPAAAGWLLFRVGRGLTYRRRAMFGLGLMSQLLVLPVAYFLVATGEALRIVLGGALGAVALAGLVLLLAPSSREAVGAITQSDSRLDATL